MHATNKSTQKQHSNEAYIYLRYLHVYESSETKESTDDVAAEVPESAS